MNPNLTGVMATSDQRVPQAPAFGSQTPQERGFPFPEAEPQNTGAPPGGGSYQVPHFVAFSSLINYYTRTYRYTFDEAMKNCPAMARVMRNEPVIMQALRERQMPVCQLSWHLEPDDPKDQYQAQAAEELTETIRRVPRLQQLLRCLQEAVWYGRYGVQLAYEWQWTSGKKRLNIRSFVPINGDKIIFRYSGQAGVLVHAAWSGTNAITDRGLAHFFSPSEREAVIIHEFEPEDADFYEADMAGAVHGLGCRGRLYWIFWLRQQVLSWMMDYLERVGAGGFTVYYYEHGNAESLAEVTTAAQMQLRNNTILFPRYKGGPNGVSGGPGVERVEASTAGAQLITELVTGYFDDIIRRYILGQDVVGESDTIVGEGPADLHAGNFARIIKYDAVDLADTLTRDFVAVLNKYMFPGNPCPRWAFDVEKPNVDEYLEGAKTFYEMGGELDEDQVREVLGISRPEPGHRILSQATMAAAQAKQEVEQQMIMSQAGIQPAQESVSPGDQTPQEVQGVYGS